MGSGKYNGVAQRTALTGNPYNAEEQRRKEKMKEPANWPKELHSFISRSFSSANSHNLSAKQKTQFKSELKELINKAINEDKIHYNDWDKQSLPSLSGKGRLELYCNSIEEDFQAKQGQAQQAQQAQTHTHSAMAHPVAPPKKRNVFDSPPPIPKKRKIERDRSASPLVDYNTRLRGDRNRMTSATRKQLRGQRFERELRASPSASSSIDTQDLNGVVVGTCKELEKNYFRLTSQPDPSKVRPEPVLKRALASLLKKYYKGQAYNYLCDQLKAIRQDLTVQGIKTQLTVTTYEFHSKLAIENGDLGEFNQCHSQLKVLYEQNPAIATNEPEFMAYWILYAILTKNQEDAMQIELQALRGRKSAFIDKVSDVLVFNETSNFPQLSELAAKLEEDDYEPATNTELSISGKHQMYWFGLFVKRIVNRQRYLEFAAFCSSFRRLPLALMSTTLHLDPKELTTFLAENHLDQYVNGDSFDSHASRAQVDSLKQKMIGKVDIKGQL